MGVVYRALQGSLGRLVALKVIRREIAAEPAYRERFMREARLVAAIDHPNVVSIYDVGEQDGHLFLAMQWIDGSSLAELLARGPLAPQDAVPIAIQIANALDAVHGTAGLVHRDIKPANVLVRRLGDSEHSYLTDFGVARPAHPVESFTNPGATIGTSGYLAPEQIRGAEPGPQSDLYALGCVFFEMIVGFPPFRAENDMALRWAHANEVRPVPSQSRPSLGTRYDDFVGVALAIEPNQRFRTGRAFSNALARIHSASPGRAGHPSGQAPRANRPSVVNQAAPPAARYTPAPPLYPSPATRQENSVALTVTIAVVLAFVIAIAVGILLAAGAFSGGGGGAHVITSKSG